MYHKASCVCVCVPLTTSTKALCLCFVCLAPRNHQTDTVSTIWLLSPSLYSLSLSLSLFLFIAPSLIRYGYHGYNQASDTSHAVPHTHTHTKCAKASPRLSDFVLWFFLPIYGNLYTLFGVICADSCLSPKCCTDAGDKGGRRRKGQRKLMEMTTHKHIDTHTPPDDGTCAHNVFQFTITARRTTRESERERERARASRTSILTKG